MINELAKQAHQNSIDKVFWEDVNIPMKLCLIHSEVSEAVEADRNDKSCILSNEYVKSMVNHSDFGEEYKKCVKGTFEEKMADIAIRLLDMCAFKKIDLEAHIKAKMKYNSLRAYKHGKKY